MTKEVDSALFKNAGVGSVVEPAPLFLTGAGAMKNETALASVQALTYGNTGTLR